MPHFGRVELHLLEFVNLTKGSVAQQLAQHEFTAIKESHVVMNVLGASAGIITNFTVVVEPPWEQTMCHVMKG